jgi:hypothetical protein
MNSVDLYKLKNDTKCVFLSENIISTILDSFSKSNIKVIRYAKKQVSAIKTNKVQAKKDLNENKIIMIMNKISDNNINELIKDYLSNILVDTEEKYNVIMTEIFNKMIKDIKFAENYIKFAMKIFIIEKKRLNLCPEEFIILLKTTINIHINENDRAACYNIIKLLVKYSFFNENIIKFISDYVLSIKEKSKYIDCYNWFNGLDNKVVDYYKTNILNIANKCNTENMNREKILIESLIDMKKQEEVSINIELDTENKFTTSIVNIIEEFQFLKSIDEVIEFIKIDCIDINNKNFFCREVIDLYSSNNNSIIDGIELIDTLIKKKILFKSNISKGLVMYLNKYDTVETKNIIEILKYLKNNNITKNIEHIFKKFKIKLYYD